MNEEPKNQIRELPRIQRRVLGVLMEKAFTTPDQYPLTLKATTTAANQKSNRDPVTDYTEDQIQDALDAMRSDLLVAEVFTDGGRAPRYRHYMRHKFDFNEAQLAIVAELLLRGKQQPGELRTRASRMVKIDSQDQLREALTGLQEKGYLQSSGPLDRRGVEVDHTFYLDKEGMKIKEVSEPSDASPAAAPAAEHSTATSPPSKAVSMADDPQTQQLLTQLAATLKEQSEVIRGLESIITDLDDRLQKLERDLGV